MIEKECGKIAAVNQAFDRAVEGFRRSSILEEIALKHFDITRLSVVIQLNEKDYVARVGVDLPRDNV